ncbi:phosphoribosyltransferase [Rhodoferax koreense]|uniref:Phosphoribosyltransferase n=1 Tax=Rhodoferax koreensis TaxID=1842727 RepID=A0A1P8K1B3_9BURK|nr:ComF family protein [Rhodoferax koreense]APW39798.1 phosphoribosyltransferase [Rhodoferax koreense]
MQFAPRLAVQTLHALRRLARTGAAWPSQCAICRAWPARPVCEACVQRFGQPRPRCRTCALALPAASTGAAQCGSCLRHPPPLDACFAAVDYAYPWSGCIAAFKFRDEVGWAHALADLMRHSPWTEPTLEVADLVLPMPLSSGRLRERGYNQALELSRCLAPHKLDAHLLLRVRDTPPQRDLSRAERQRNVRGAFVLDPLRASVARGKRVVLVDDVMTSGASLFAAALAVREGGAASVSALVLARTPAD